MLPWDHNAYYHRLLLSAVPRGASQVLEVGCGAGRLAAELAVCAEHVDAIDRDADMITAVRAVVPINVACWQADVMDTPLAPNSYDAIVSMSVRVERSLFVNVMEVSMSLPAEEGRTSDESSLIDDFGRRIGTAMGWPRMAGRAAAVLMLSEQPMTLAQLQHELRASKGSVSEITRLLMTHGTVTRFKQPGARYFVYQWRDDAWVGCLEHQLEQTKRLLTLAESAHIRAGDVPATQQNRIEEMHEYYRFITCRLETLLDDYAARWRERHPRTET